MDLHRARRYQLTAPRIRGAPPRQHVGRHVLWLVAMDNPMGRDSVLALQLRLGAVQLVHVQRG